MFCSVKSTSSVPILSSSYRTSISAVTALATSALSFLKVYRLTTSFLKASCVSVLAGIVVYKITACVLSCFRKPKDDRYRTVDEPTEQDPFLEDFEVPDNAHEIPPTKQGSGLSRQGSGLSRQGSGLVFPLYSQRANRS